jgi:hypothetical protein
MTVAVVRVAVGGRDRRKNEGDWMGIEGDMGGCGSGGGSMAVAVAVAGWQWIFIYKINRQFLKKEYTGYISNFIQFMAIFGCF